MKLWLAIVAPAEGELALGAFGLACQTGEARAVGFSLADTLRPFFEDAARPKIVCDHFQ